MAKRKLVEGQPSLFQPQITWRARDPADWPDYTKASIIGIDTENKDVDLRTKGPSAARGEGFVAGVSLSSPEHGSLYLPLRHAGGGNVDPGQARRYLQTVLGTDVPKAMANATYDCEWLRTEEVRPQGPIYDILVADALLDETLSSYDLDHVARRRIGRGKNEKLLKEGADGWGVHPKSGIWQMPAGYAGEYAEDDADLPWRTWLVQQPLLAAEGLLDVMDLERRLIPCLVDMRYRGVPFNVEKAEALIGRLKADEEAQTVEMKRLLGGRGVIEVTKARVMGRCFDELGIHYPRTPKTGDPSFKDEWLQTVDHPFARCFAKAKHLNKAAATIQNYLDNFVTAKGRIHPTFAAVKGEEGGADTGRFSSKNPNLQAVPAKEEKYGVEIRDCFEPEPGCRWGALDYSQQEPRVTIHYAYVTRQVWDRRQQRMIPYPNGLPGAAKARQRYIDDPTTDYHQLIADMASIERKPAKTLNLGCAYGQGYYSIMKKLNLPEEEARYIYESYHREVPYVKLLGDECSRVAGERGYMRTLFGRRRHFNLYEPDLFGRQDVTALPLEAAKLKWLDQKLRRAYVHKALNSAVQGSSADMVKKAMVDIHEAGLNFLHVTVHDELGQSIESDKHLRLVTECMLDCIKLEVPLKVDQDVGTSWGLAKAA